MEGFGTLADAHGFSRIDHDDIDKLRDHDAKSLMRHVGLPLWKFPQVGAYFKRLTAADISLIILFDGMREVLQTLSASFSWTWSAPARKRMCATCLARLPHCLPILNAG